MEKINFKEAIKLTIKGKNLKRKCWNKQELGISKEMGYIGVYRFNEKEMHRPLCVEDILAKDWIMF